MTTPKTAEQINAHQSDWVKCPICGDVDMHKTTDKEGDALIECVNHACRSNGGDYEEPNPSAMKRNIALRMLVEKWKSRAIDPDWDHLIRARRAFDLCAKELEEVLSG